MRNAKEICEDIALRYEIEFLEIGTDDDHVHFFVRSVPMYSPKKIVQIIKSITAREIFKQMPEVVGRTVLVGRLLCQHRWRTRFGRSDKAICQKSRSLKSKYSTPAVLKPRQLAARKFIGERFLRFI